MDIDKALLEAVKTNNEKSLLLLLSQFPDQVGHRLKSTQLLHDAIRNSALKIIPILLDHGANINGCLDKKCNLTQVVDVDVLELLLSRGADPNVKIGSILHTHPIHTFMSREFRFTLGESCRFVNFSLYTYNQIKNFIECLIKHGGEVDIRDGLGQTALHIAARGAYDDYSVSVLQFLKDNGTEVNATDYVGKTPLWNAVNYQNVKNVQWLIDNGANIHLVYRSTGRTVLFETINEAILKILLDNCAEVKNRNGDSPLNSLLEKSNIGKISVKRLIDAGCDVNHVNSNGSTVLTLATKYVDITLLELLVHEGADVNASERRHPYKNAITAMLRALWNNRERATSCINYLLDHNANIDNVHPSVIHCFITSRCLCIIPRFIARGLAPAYLSIELSAISRFRSKRNISPLMMALLLNQSDLARYFINIKYLLKSDIDFLYGSKESKIFIEEVLALDSLELLTTFSQCPLSLETLCFVVLSDTLGPTNDRRSKVQKLGLPQPMQNLLLFKNVTKNYITDIGTRNLLLFKYSLQQLNLYQVDSKDENSNSVYFWY